MRAIWISFFRGIFAQAFVSMDFWGGGAIQAGNCAREFGARLHRGSHQDGVSDIDAYR
jgi:hypothetical protein